MTNSEIKRTMAAAKAAARRSFKKTGGLLGPAQWAATYVWEDTSLFEEDPAFCRKMAMKAFLEATAPAPHAPNQEGED